MFSNLGTWKEREESNTHFQNTLCKSMKAKLREAVHLVQRMVHYYHRAILLFLQNLIRLSSLKSPSSSMNFHQLC